MKIKYLILAVGFILSVNSTMSQSTDENYIKTIELLEPVDVNTLSNSFSSIKKIETVSYFDGFGKLKQSVAIKQSSDKKDLVQYVEYDEFGMRSKEYLTLPTSQINGEFNSNAKNEILQYYNNNFADQNPFSETIYDNSPLNRKLESSNPGNDWRIINNSDNDHTTKYNYELNSSSEVDRIEINESNAFTNDPFIVSSYTSNQLLKNIVKSENWKTTDGKLNTKETFTDKNGRKIADFTYVTDEGQVKKLPTYYVYDNSGNLRYLIPPKAVDEMWDDIQFNPFFQTHSWTNLVVNPSLVPSGSGTFGIRLLTTGTNNQTGRLSLSFNANFAGLSFPGGSDEGAELKQGDIVTFPSNSGLPDKYLFSIYSQKIKDIGLIDPNGNPVLINDLNSPNEGYSRYEYSIKNGKLHVEFKVGTNPFSPTTPFKVKSLIGDREFYIPGRVFNNDVLDDLIYQYKYDNFNRKIAQKTPGKGWEYMVYDMLDRPILTQDANLKEQNKWLFNKYDAFGRVIYSGYYSSTKTREELQNDADNFIDSNFVNGANIESKISTSSSVGGVSINYTNNAFPTTDIETLTVSYYDNYNFSNSDFTTIPTTILGQSVLENAKGLLTSSWTKTIGENTWSKNYSFYDEKGRNIYVYDKNRLGGYTENKSKLDFRGKVINSVTNHKKVSSSTNLTIQDNFEYDHAERPISHYQQINSQEPELIAENKYNELGQLIQKKVGGESGLIGDEFIDVQNLTISGNVITKTSSSGWNGGLATRAEFTGDGHIEYEVLQKNKYLMVGLSSDNTNAHYNTLDFAIYNHANGYVYIYESGSNKGNKGTYNAGDVFKVKREGNSIKYFKNEEVIYTSLTSSTGKLIGDISILSLNSKIRNLKLSSGYTDIVGGLNVSNTINDRQEISKITGGSSWNAGLATTKSFSGDGKVSYRIAQTNKYLMVGLSDVNTNAHYNTLDFAIYNHANGYAYIYESGSNKGNFGRYQVDDEFSVERKGTTIYYKKNGDTFYTSTVSSSGNLLGDLSFHTVGAKIYDFKIKGYSKGLQTVDYTYNIRGWLTNVNDVDALGDDLFAYKLKYNEATEGTGTASNLYGGNIKQAIWKSAINNVKKSYAYNYDELGRFLNSKYRENNSLTGGAGKFETNSLNYDLNGNIEQLKRFNQSAQLIDNLNYVYDSGNKLFEIDDTTNNANGFKEGTNSGNDYDYDTNGNLTKDLNKNITNIEYNYLDLVERVTFSNGSKIEFTYNSNGTKLQMKNIPSSGSTTTVDYLGGFQYTNNQLEFFPTPEGYASSNGSLFKHVYVYKDHLGNNRLTFSDTDGNNEVTASEIQSNTDYYVMGLIHYGEIISGLASNYNYKLHGKEKLGFAGYNMYDFGSRMYDPSVGRWFNADPKNQYWSPYMAMGNNYIVMVDPDGEWVHILIGAVVGGVINVVGNWDNIEDFGDGLAYFGIGAGAGAYTAATGDIYGAAAITSIGNSAFTQYNKTGEVDWGKTLFDGAMGVATAGIGAKIAPVIAPYTDKLFSNIGSPLAQKYLSDAVGNTVSGIGLGTLSGLAQGESLSDSFNASLESIPQSLIISGIGTTGSHLNNKYNYNKREKARIKAEQEQQNNQQQNNQQQSNQQQNSSLTKYNPYPENDGAVLGTKEVISLKKGTILDRYGSDFGSYLSPFDTPFGNRSLGDWTKPSQYRTYEVLKPFNVEQSVISPYYNQPGFGIQYRTNFIRPEFNINTLINTGYLKRVYLLKK